MSYDQLEMAVMDYAGVAVDGYKYSLNQKVGGCRAPAEAFILAFRDYGIDITWREAREPMGNKKDVHIRKITQMDSVKQKFNDVYGRDPNEEDVQKIFQTFVPHQLPLLVKYADLIPGFLEAIEEFRDMGLKIGSTTGYMGNTEEPDKDMMKILLVEVEKRGYVPDSTVCATGHSLVTDGRKLDFKDYKQVYLPEARPAPWMCIENAKNFNIWPLHKCAKFDDTISGIQGGLNAGMWAIGFSGTGTYMALVEEDFQEKNPGQFLPQEIYERENKRIESEMYKAGAHFVVEGPWVGSPVLHEINKRLKRGERP